MGFSFRNRVIIIYTEHAAEAAQEWFDALPEEIDTNFSPQPALRRIIGDSGVIVLDSSGHGIFDLASLEWPDEFSFETLGSAFFEQLGPEGKAQVWCLDGEESPGECPLFADPEEPSLAYMDVDQFLSYMPESGDWSDNDENATALSDGWSLALQEAWTSVYRVAIERHLEDRGLRTKSFVAFFRIPGIRMNFLWSPTLRARIISCFAGFRLLVIPFVYRLGCTN